MFAFTANNNSASYNYLTDMQRVPLKTYETHADHLSNLMLPLNFAP